MAVAARRLRIVGVSEGATVLINGREAAIGDYCAAGDTIGARVTSNGTVMRAPHVDTEEE